MTPEQAFEKWWDKAKNRCSGADGSYSPWFSHECAFYAGQQYQETNQLMVLADIRKAVGDGKGRLMGDELVQRVEDLVGALKEMSAMYTHTWDKVDGGLSMHSSSVERFDAACARADQLLKSVTTEKEEAA